MKRTYTIYGIIILLLFWFLASTFNIVKPIFLPPPQAVFLKLFELTMSGKILYDFTATLLRTLAGFILAAGFGIPIGLLVGYYKKIYNLLEFPVDFFRSIPAAALFPLFLLIFGIGDKSKIAVVVFACSLIMLVHTAHGVTHVKELRIVAARVMKAKEIDILLKVIFPDTLPIIFTGLRISLSMALVLVVVTEMFIGTYVGLGRVIMDAQYLYRVDAMYAVIIITGLLGYILNQMLYRIENNVVHWSGK